MSGSKNSNHKKTLLRVELLDEIFLLRTPYPTAIILFSYLYFILKCGPAYMKGKKAFQLKTLVLAYDAVQIFLNLYLLSEAIKELSASEFNYTCFIPNRAVMKLGYYFYLLKLFDLVETIFYVLRKKNNQISFLHVYHHFLMVMVTWYLISMAGHVFYFGIINCVVHTVMYSYYFISAYNPNNKFYKIKKFVTQIQLLQFCIGFVHCLWPIVFGHCYVSRFLLALIMPQPITMIYLFSKFYINTYMKEKKVEK